MDKIKLTNKAKAEKAVLLHVVADCLAVGWVFASKKDEDAYNKFVEASKEDK